MKVNIGICGLGRMGRSILYLLKNDQELVINVINDNADPDQLAYLLKYDTIRGISKETINYSNGVLQYGDRRINLTNKNVGEFKWNEYDVDIVVDSSGSNLSQELSDLHKKNNAKISIFTALMYKPDITIIMGINEFQFNRKKHFIISNGSCTSYSLGIIANLLNNNYVIKRGYVSNIHSYTSEQKILDAPYPKKGELKRCRSGAANIIPTSSGAAEGINRVIPGLENKLVSAGYRVPVINGSLIDLIVETEKQVSVDEVNSLIKDKALELDSNKLLSWTNDPIVSSDIIGNQFACVVDINATVVLGGNLLRLNMWQDNEAGYAYQTVRLLKYISEVAFS